MPEIGEVARVVHYIRKHLAGKTLEKVVAKPDENVYGKVGCSAEAFEKALTGKKVLDAKQQGKYFWMIMSSPPHPLMHFGMAGWLKLKNEETAYYKPRKPEDKQEEWPPKYWKFVLETAEEPKCEAAFVDLRRFGRIRLIDCEADEIRNVSPLVENGPDPIQDEGVVTEEWLTEKLQSKRIPIKALLLDQGNISGIGNWVGDEILYNAKIHPEQYSNTLTAPQISQLHKSIHYICKFAVDNLSDSSKFPEEWLFKHRWGKGKKDSATTLPDGQKFVYLTVGGRTSCVVPSVQKKTGKVAGDVKVEDAEGDGVDGDEGAAKGRKGGKKGAGKAAAKKEMEDSKEIAGLTKKIGQGEKRGAKHEEDELFPDGDEIIEQPPKKKRKSAGTKDKETNHKANGVKSEARTETNGRRRSGRVGSKGK